MAQPDIDFKEYNLRQQDGKAIVKAIHEQSVYPIHRTFRNVKTKTAAYTMDTLLDRTLLVSGVTTITLPPAGDADHVVYTIVRVGTDTVSVTVPLVTDGTIDGVDVFTTPATIGTRYESISVASDGTNYFRVDNNS